MKAEEFDAKFDNGEDITEFIDLSNAHRPGYEQKRVNIDFPIWMIEALEYEAKRLGVTSDSIIKLWLAERLDKKIITQ
ncbi:CopG family transcriptional regulator [Nostoc sp. 'Peltigera membranacea cyanobiont' 213]|uniref:type II toxin-antitoxin system BrnA family antitoxin n=1 Tax=unclassified Nostoc TaxID=2593658 RepID=UPI000B952DB6|nr:MULTISPECIES: CopG family antitoxin [unclassified Nostoc]AVH67013.1 CopG family transcriptional regulator [Nostoc sp. 'Peltigera membranacea cyanobiont' N6]OYD95892.1 CopG family transcriptional regulator [Nostoc sp. 'Peltigera membranacea cyanobiont' 213]